MKKSGWGEREQRATITESTERAPSFSFCHACVGSGGRVCVCFPANCFFFYPAAFGAGGGGGWWRKRGTNNGTLRVVDALPLLLRRLPLPPFLPVVRARRVREREREPTRRETPRVKIFVSFPFSSVVFSPTLLSSLSLSRQVVAAHARHDGARIHAQVGQFGRQQLHFALLLTQAHQQVVDAFLCFGGGFGGGVGDAALDVGGVGGGRRGRRGCGEREKGGKGLAAFE